MTLAPGVLLATGERLEVTQGSGPADLLHDLSPEAQTARFGQVMFDVITEPADVHEETRDSYARAQVLDDAHRGPTQRADGRPALRLVQDDETP